MSAMNVFAEASYYYSTNTETTSNPAGAAAVFAFIGAYFIFIIALYFVYAFLLSRVFKKAGQPEWAAYVPFYNTWILFELGGKPGWLIFLAFIPFVGGIALFVVQLLTSLELAKRFGKSQVFGIFGLWLFSLIGYAMLAFDDSKYHGPTLGTANGQKPTTPPQTPPATV